MSRYDFAFDWDGPYGHAVRLVADHAPAGGLVLDLGCGAAAIAEPLAAAGFGYHGVDVDTETVERLRARGLPASVVDLTSDKAALELRDIVAGSTVAAGWTGTGSAATTSVRLLIPSAAARQAASTTSTVRSATRRPAGVNDTRTPRWSSSTPSGSRTTAPAPSSLARAPDNPALLSPAGSSNR